MRKKLNDIQIIEAYELYCKKNLSTIKLGKIYQCCPGTIQRSFERAGFSLKDHSVACRRYPINQEIFDNIDTEEKAYWLGFLYADGNVATNSNRIRLSLAAEDIEVVEKFSNFIFNFDRVKIYKKPENKKGQDLVYLDICNKHIKEKLIKWGCPPKKTFILVFPDWLEQRFLFHFIRGYFDGDGCLSNYKEKKKSKGKLTYGNIIGESERSDFSLLSTLEFINSINSILSKLDINSYVSKRHKKRINNNFNLKVRGNLQIQRLMDYLYKDATIYMQRKYEKYLQLKEINLKKILVKE